MKEYLIDANILLRYFLRDAPEQSKEIEAFFIQSKHRLNTNIVPVLVVAEVYFVLTSFYKISAQDVCRQFSDFCKLQYIGIEERDIVQRIFAGTDCVSIGFIDTYLLYRAKNERRGLFTFDKKLQKFASSG